MKGVLAKAFLFCRLEMLPLHLQGYFNVSKSGPGCGGSAFPEDNFQVTRLFINVPEKLGGSAGNIMLSSSLSSLTRFLGDPAPAPHPPMLGLFPLWLSNYSPTPIVILQ